jgi:hypothetical protein
MNNHTPGPWEDCGSGDVQGIEDNGFGKGPVDVCSVYLRTVEGRTEANTRLIAAAPDLLEALQKLLSHGTFEDYPNTSEWYAVRDARAAIAKATGGQA